jgi:hypothetical protein
VVLIVFLQENYNAAISILNPLFEKHYSDSLSARDKKYPGEEDNSSWEKTSMTEGNVKKQQSSKTSWRWKSFVTPASCAVFHPGIVDLSPGWFMSRHEVSKPIIWCICHD